MNADETQSLSKISLILFVILMASIVLGLTTKLKPRAVHWLTVISFSSCLMLSILTSLIYFWHHWIRP